MDIRASTDRRTCMSRSHPSRGSLRPLWSGSSAQHASPSAFCVAWRDSACTLLCAALASAGHAMLLAAATAAAATPTSRGRGFRAVAPPTCRMPLCPNPPRRRPRAAVATCARIYCCNAQSPCRWRWCSVLDAAGSTCPCT
eukprot:scaffold314100_cov31-Tisochrysis_lutea.AAC.1